MLDGDKDAFAELAKSGMVQGAKLVTTMVNAAADGDEATLARSAHSMKGTAGDFGATALVEHTRAIEKLAKAGEIEKAAKLVGSLEGIFDASMKAVQAVVTEHED